MAGQMQSSVSVQMEIILEDEKRRERMQTERQEHPEAFVEYGRPYKAVLAEFLANQSKRFSPLAPPSES